MNEKSSKVMLVDDHAMLRHGMAMLLNEEADLEVIAEADDVGSALTLLASGCRPDVVLVDITLKTHSGLELIKNIRVLQPDLPVLVVSMHDESAYAERALHAGAQGYVMKSEPGEILVRAIRAVLQGEIFLSDSMRDRLKDGSSASASRIASLTPTEFEILHLIGSGHSSQQIAEKLQRSIKTIETHRANIREKLELKDGADLIRFSSHWVQGG